MAVYSHTMVTLQAHYGLSTAALWLSTATLWLSTAALWLSTTALWLSTGHYEQSMAILQAIYGHTTVVLL